MLILQQPTSSSTWMLRSDESIGNIISGCFPNRLDAAILKCFPNDVKSRVEQLLKGHDYGLGEWISPVFRSPKTGWSCALYCYINVDVVVAYQALVDVVSTVIEPYVSLNFEDRILSHRLRALSSPAMFQRSQEAYSNYINSSTQTGQLRAIHTLSTSGHRQLLRANIPS